MFKFLLSTIFLIASTSVSAHDFEANNNGTPIYFNLREGGKAVEVTFRGSQPQDVINEYKGEVVIPNAITFDGTTYPVTGIGEAAFMGCTELVTIHIPSSVTSLGANAFYDCKRLTSVYYNLPAEEVTSISEEVFPCDFLLTQEKLLAFFFGEMGIFVYFCPHYKINEKIHRHIHWTHGHRLPDLLQGSGG